MMGTDVRIRRDPLAMRMREDQIKQSTACFLSLIPCPFVSCSKWSSKIFCAVH